MSYTLLLIEDDEDIRLILSSVLASIENLEVLEAENAASARAVMQSHKVNGILLDYQLPDISGEELLGEIMGESASGSLDIVMLSARDDGELVEKWLKLGAKAVLRKPFNPFELLAQLQVHFDF